MTRLSSALTGLILMLTLTVGAFAADCPDKNPDRCKGNSCPRKVSTKK